MVTIDKDNWIGRWEQGDTPWIRQEAEDELKQLYDDIIAKNSLSNISPVFVPLCGDSKSLRFFYDKGHSVTGIDISELAIANLVQRDFPNISFSKKNDNEEILYTAERLKLICADFFKASLKSKFSFIYDRASFVAVKPEQRESYLSIIKNSLAKNGVYFLITYDYRSENPEPPYSVSESDFDKLFSSMNCIFDNRVEEEIPERFKDKDYEYFLKRVSIFKKC